METEQSTRFFSYLLLLGSFFAVLFILDSILEFRHQPEEHSINQEANEQSKEQGVPIAKEKKVVERPADNETESAKTDGITKPEVLDDKTFFEDLRKEYQEEFQKKLQPNQSRTDIVIRYYRHPPDGNGAYALQDLGYYIHERPVASQYSDFQSNAIYYGDNVNIRDVQLVAYTLLMEGLPIKTIKPSRFGDSWKSNSIEIGTDTSLVNLPTLTLSDLREFSL